MDVAGSTAVVSGGASGLGEATVRLLVERGGRVAVADVDDDRGRALCSELGDAAAFFHADVTEADEVQAAVAGAAETLGDVRLVVGCAGIGLAERVLGREGPARIQAFERVLKVNLIGMYNVLRLGAAAMGQNEADAEGERGVAVMTASIAAFDGQVGQTAYAASKAGIAGMTLPAARDLAGRGIRVCTIAPGLFDTPLLAALPQEARTALGAGVHFPRRLGMPSEYAETALFIAANRMLNGETIRLDGALRMPPK